MVSDHDRRELYSVLESQLGQGPAGTLMDLLPPVGWADVARRSDITTLRGEMAVIRGEMAEMRGEMTTLGARIDAQLPKLMWANAASMVGVAGLVLAAAKLA